MAASDIRSGGRLAARKVSVRAAAESRARPSRGSPKFVHRCGPSPRAPRKESRLAGFVLLEVLVGLSLFTVGVVAVLGSLQVSVAAVERSEKLLRATLLLDEIARRFSLSSLKPHESSGIHERGYEWSAVYEPWTDGEPRPFPGEVASASEEESAPADARAHFEILRVTVAWEERGKRRMLETQEIVEAPEVSAGAPEDSETPEGERGAGDGNESSSAGAQEENP
jgi:type II secretory pathway pseudopilin PulG